MSPPLVVAFALAGRIDVDLRKDPIGKGKDGKPVYLADIWPHAARSGRDDSEVDFLRHVHARATARSIEGDAQLARLARPQGRNLRLGEGLHLHSPRALLRRHDAEARAGRRTSRARACWPCSATASPPTTFLPRARSRKTARPENICIEHGVKPADFNSYGSRRGNHEVMVRGTFANVRLRNKMVPDSKADSRAICPMARRCRSSMRRKNTSPKACRW